MTVVVLPRNTRDLPVELEVALALPPYLDLGTTYFPLLRRNPAALVRFRLNVGISLDGV